jgi:uncharacterized protein YndB with AHSA1/START domain
MSYATSAVSSEPGFGRQPPEKLLPSSLNSPLMVESGGSARFPYRAKIVDISAPELIVLEAEEIPDAGIDTTITRVTFEALGERTRMTITSGPYTDEVRANAEAGWIDLTANLERVLAAA